MKVVATVEIEVPDGTNPLTLDVIGVRFTGPAGSSVGREAHREEGLSSTGYRIIHAETSWQDGP